MSGGVGGAGLDAVGVRIVVAPGAPDGDEVVGGVEGAGLGEVGGGQGDVARVADAHEILVLHGLFRDEVQIPGGGIVLAVMKAGGVDEVGVLTAQSLGLGVHGVHKGVHIAADGLGQNDAGLVGGDHQHAVQKLLHRHDLAHLDAGGAAVAVQLRDGIRSGELLIQGELAAVHRLQHQKCRHDLGEAGGIELLVLVFGVNDIAGVGVHQQCRLGLDVRVSGKRGLFGGDGKCQQIDQQGHEEKNREKTLCFHIQLL